MGMFHLYLDNRAILCYNRFIETIIFGKIDIENNSGRRSDSWLSETNASYDLPFITTDD